PGLVNRWIGLCLLFAVPALAQNSDDQYRKPLKEVLTTIEQRFKVTLQYTPEMVKDKFVNYADWRFRNDVEQTLKNVLTPLDMKADKSGSARYKLKYYEYYRWTVEDGWAELDRLASLYSNREEWETRKRILKPCLLEALRLSPLPPAPGSAPIITARRKFSGYSVENVALEILPGLYVNGSLYRPDKIKGKIPVILNPDGHWGKQRYRPDCQYRCATLAR